MDCWFNCLAKQIDPKRVEVRGRAEREGERGEEREGGRGGGGREREGEKWEGGRGREKEERRKEEGGREGGTSLLMVSWRQH